MIEKVIIKIGKKRVELTMEEAEQLHGELDNLFGKEYLPAPVIPYPSPVYPRPYFDYPLITSSANTLSIDLTAEV